MRMTTTLRKGQDLDQGLNGAVANGLLALPARFHRLSLQQYHRMIDVGILNEDDRVELLGGYLVDKMTHKPPHDATIDLTLSQLQSRLPGGWRVRVQSAITTADSEPEPDLAVVRGPAQRYMRSHPRNKDIGLLIEVSDTTLDQDRYYKCWLYAKARIRVYWIINLVEGQIEVYTQPKGTGQSAAYQHREDFGLAESVPLVVDGKKMGSISVRNILL